MDTPTARRSPDRFCSRQSARSGGAASVAPRTHGRGGAAPRHQAENILIAPTGGEGDRFRHRAVGRKARAPLTITIRAGRRHLYHPPERAGAPPDPHGRIAGACPPDDHGPIADERHRALPAVSTIVRRASLTPPTPTGARLDAISPGGSSSGGEAASGSLEDDRPWTYAVALLLTVATATGLWAFLVSTTPRFLRPDEVMPMIMLPPEHLPDGRVLSRARFETWPILGALAAFALALAGAGMLRLYWVKSGLAGGRPHARVREARWVSSPASGLRRLRRRPPLPRRGAAPCDSRRCHQVTPPSARRGILRHGGTARARREPGLGRSRPGAAVYRILFPLDRARARTHRRRHYLVLGPGRTSPMSIPIERAVGPRLIHPLVAPNLCAGGPDCSSFTMIQAERSFLLTGARRPLRRVQPAL